jgi:predicted RecA/RadA family phage recombinase
MANFIQDGKIIDYKNTGTTTILYGDIVTIGTRVAVAMESIAPGQTGGIRMEGVFEVDALTTEVFSVGDTVYLDESNKATKTKGSLTVVMGYVVQPKASATAKAQIKIG